jgi:hypothetical protein
LDEIFGEPGADRSLQVKRKRPLSPQGRSKEKGGKSRSQVLLPYRLPVTSELEPSRSQSSLLLSITVQCLSLFPLRSGEPFEVLVHEKDTSDGGILEVAEMTQNQRKV